MAKNRTRVVLTTEEKFYKAIQALFVLHARQVGMGNEEMRKILGGEKADINAVAKVVNKTLKKNEKNKKGQLLTN